MSDEFDDGLVRINEVVSITCFTGFYVARKTFRIKADEDGKAVITLVQGFFDKPICVVHGNADSVKQALIEHKLIAFLKPSKLIYGNGVRELR